MKIGIILDCPPNAGGSFQYAMSMLSAVSNYSKKRNIEVIAFVLEEKWHGHFAGNNTSVVKLSGQYMPDIITIDKHQCDIIISTSQNDWSERLSTPTVTPIHDLMHRYESKYEEVGTQREYISRDRMFLSIVKNSAGILVDSQTGAQHVTEIYGKYYEDKIYILPYVVPGYLSNPCKEIKVPFHKYFFYPAQFWTHKNHLNLIKAMAKLNKKGIFLNFIFVGAKKNGYENVLDEINKCGLEKQVHIMGYVPNEQMRYLYENARAMVMPTFFGPTNIPPLEAVVLGCPAAVSRIYGMPEQLGDAVLYFDPNNIDEIAEILQLLWKNDDVCRELRAKEKLKAKTFTQKRFNSNFEIIFEDILKKQHQYILLETLIKFCRIHSNIYIYGAGKIGYSINRIMLKYHIYINAIIVTSKGENEGAEECFNKSIYEVDSCDFETNASVIMCIPNKYQDEVKRILINKNIKSENIYIVQADIIDCMGG